MVEPQLLFYIIVPEEVVNVFLQAAVDSVAPVRKPTVYESIILICVYVFGCVMLLTVLSMAGLTVIRDKRLRGAIYVTGIANIIATSVGVFQEFGSDSSRFQRDSPPPRQPAISGQSLVGHWKALMVYEERRQIEGGHIFTTILGEEEHAFAMLYPSTRTLSFGLELTR